MSDVQKLERLIEDSKVLLERRDMALRLAQNSDFKKLFLDMYFVTEAARLVQISGDITLNKESRDDALAMAQATGHCKRYLQMLTQMGANIDLDEMQQHLQAARTEEADLAALDAVDQAYPDREI